MPKPVRDGGFYEFNRPVGHYEVGFEIQESMAQMDIRFRRDVYPPRAAGAKAIAKEISPFPPTWHPPHAQLYFPHYHQQAWDSGISSTGRAAKISNDHRASLIDRGPESEMWHDREPNLS